jgi:hypothetical protein
MKYPTLKSVFTVSVCLGLAASARAADYEWKFSLGDLSARLGSGLMTYADAATPGLTSFGITDGTTVPHIGGLPTRYMHVPAFTVQANGYKLEFVGSGPNGGGAYINQYTFLFDVMIPGSLNWTPFFNTNPGNGNDADFYATDTGALGIGALGYSSAGAIAANTWYRVVFAADLGAGTASYYVNGVSVKTRTGSSLLEGRFALYSNSDPGPDVLLFNEGDSSGVYTHELYVSSIAFTDRTLTAADILAFGGPNPDGIFTIPEPSTLGLVALGLGLITLRLRRNHVSARTC